MKKENPLSEINKVFFDLRVLFDHSFEHFNYKKSLLDFTSILQRSDQHPKTFKKDLLSLYTKTLDDIATIKTTLLMSFTRYQTKIHQLDMQFVGKINELSSSLKSYANSTRSQCKSVLKLSPSLEVKEKIKDMDKLLISYYDKCKGIFSSIKTIHRKVPSESESDKLFKRIIRAEKATPVKVRTTSSNYEATETQQSEGVRRMATSPNTSTYYKKSSSIKYRNKSPSNMDNSINSISTKSNISINQNCVSAMGICEKVREFLSEMRNLQEAIVRKSSGVELMKKNFERKKKKLFLLCSGVVKEGYDPSMTNKLKQKNQEIIALSQDNDALKQSNELLSAQINEMKMHISKLSVTEKERSKVRKVIEILSKKIALIFAKVKMTFTNPISMTSSPKDHTFETSTKPNSEILSDEVAVEEIAKKAENEYSEIIYVMNAKSVESQKVKSSLYEIHTNLSEISKFTQKFSDDDNEINVINGTNSNPINLLDDTDRSSVSRKSSNSNNVNLLNNSNVTMMTVNEMISSIFVFIETIRKNIAMSSFKSSKKLIKNGKKRSSGNSSNILSEDKKDDANIIQFLNENISKEEFLSNGIDGGEITFDNN